MQRTEIADSIVRETARPETDPDDPRMWPWVAASVWTERMLAALGNGVRGGKWHSYGFVRRRLRAILRKREKRPGFGRTPRDHHRWPNTFFAKHGLFTLHEAHALASQSR